MKQNVKSVKTVKSAFYEKRHLLLLRNFMSLFFLSIGLIGFILYFYGIGLRYLGFLPIIFLGAFLSYYGMTSLIKNKGSEVLNKYSLYIAWVIILTGIVGILNFFQLDLLQIGLTLIGTNILLRIGSYLAKYKDGTSVFQLGYYLSLLFVLITGSTLSNTINAFQIFSSLWIFNFAITGFIVYIIGIFKETGKQLLYSVFIFGIGSILLVLLDQISNIYLSLSIGIIFLTVIFSLIYKVMQNKPISPKKKKKTSIRRILAGERITEAPKYFNSRVMENLYNYIADMPKASKRSLEIINIILMLTVIISYLLHRQTFATIDQFLYRVIIAFFIGNVFILKKIDFNSMLQNLVVFLVINFAIYLSLFSFFNGDIGSIVTRGIIWNLASSIALFYAPRFMKNILEKIDYTYRTIATLIALAVNIVLLIKTEIPGQLIFFFILLYVGIQGMLLFYATKYVMRKSDETEDSMMIE